MECYKQKPTSIDKTIFYIYHIPGKKIGVTRNLNKRLTVYQGYKPGEYEVLETSEDIDYISAREKELQQSYGYKVDETSYNKLFKLKKMRISSSDLSTTFSCPINKLKGNLMDMKGEKFINLDNEYVLNDKLIKFILKNVHPSKYNDTTCFVYNKKLKEGLNKFSDSYNKSVEKLQKVSSAASDFTKKVHERNLELIEAMKAELISSKNGLNQVYTDLENKENNNNRFELIRAWADKRGLYDKGDTKTQYCKLMEEAGELGRAVLKNDQAEFEDAIGDMVVVLTNLAHLGGTTIENCVDSAYNVISKRTGKMVNGTFVKDK